MPVPNGEKQANGVCFPFDDVTFWYYLFDLNDLLPID